METVNKNFPRPTMLMILDGFGKTEKIHGNAILAANTPFLDKLFANYPNTTLNAGGLSVGLPEGQMGNSEVGHMNIGAGRIVYQELSRINQEIASEFFFENSIFTDAMNSVIENNSSLHLIGLLSDGGVHSHISHLFALLELAYRKNIKRVYVHALLDGRDVPPSCAEKYIAQLEDEMEKLGVGKIASIGGRYYGMDRDKRWERVKLHFDAINSGVGKTANSALDALKMAYTIGETDEFVSPTVILDNTKANFVCKNDAVIMFNFRPDRARQLAEAFTNPNFTGFERNDYKENLHFVCMTNYDKNLTNVKVAYPPQILKNTLGEYLSNLGLHQLRIAETEKYAHVTFFFNGGIEQPYTYENRILIPSPKVATYDLKPEMSAFEVTDELEKQIKSGKYDFIVLNFANSDMVGHTGVFDAAKRAIEALDKCIERLVNTILKEGGQLLLTADHGNSDEMLDDEGNILTAHSLNPVPLIHISNKPKRLAKGGALCDLAPTLLELMDLPIPPEMTGRSLIK